MAHICPTDLVQDLDSLMYWLWQASQWTCVILHMKPNKLGPRVLQKQVQIFLT